MAVSVLVSACSGGEGEQDSAGAPTAPAESTAPVSTTDRTGIPAVDAVIDAMLRKDGQTIAAMLQMRECPLSFSLQCGQLSEEERKQVFLASSCEGRAMPAETARRIVASYWSPSNSEVGPIELYGVYVPREDPFGLGSEYVVVVRTVNTRAGTATIERLEIRGDRVVFIGFGCGPLRTESVDRWILGPFSDP